MYIEPSIYKSKLHVLPCHVSFLVRCVSFLSRRVSFFARITEPAILEYITHKKLELLSSHLLFPRGWPLNRGSTVVTVSVYVKFIYFVFLLGNLKVLSLGRNGIKNLNGLVSAHTK